MQSNSKWPTVLIVAITLGLVFGPVFFPREIARWYLAAAHNAFRKQDSVLGEHYLKRAEAWDPSIVRDGDYWIAQVPKADRYNVTEKLDMIERAVLTDSRWRLEAVRAADRLTNEFDFQNAVRALKIASLGERPTNVADLNQLAYTRAQAGIELKEALKDIDRAIARAGPLPSLLDTKAWVLHGLKRNLEAWGFMNEAIKAVELEFAKAKLPLPKPLALDPNEVPESADDQSNLDFLEWPEEHAPVLSVRERQQLIREARRRIGQNGFILVIMRYHRLRILEALKQTKLADEDRRWLEERGVPIMDELF